MKLIKPSFEIIEQKSGLEGIYEQIELAGRTCYKSQRPEGTTAKDFVNRMIASSHNSMLEHGTVYLKVPVNIDVAGDFLDDIAIWTKCKLVKEDTGNWWAVTTNYRRIVELGYQDYLKYLCEPTEFHEKRITIRFNTDIGVSREFNRHRVNSIAEQSTRYCNFSKDKFDNEISVCISEELQAKENLISRCMIGAASVDYCGDPLQGFCKVIGQYPNRKDEFNEIDYWLFANLACEYSYMNLIRLGWKPQQARRVLPIDLATELVHTAFISDWKHLFNLRTSFIAETGKPHPDMSALCDPLYKEFINRKLFNE